jgi:hypothetical protein
MGMCENCNGTDYDMLQELLGKIFAKLFVVKYEGFCFRHRHKVCHELTLLQKSNELMYILNLNVIYTFFIA